MNKRSFVTGIFCIAILTFVQDGLSQPTDPVPYDGAASVHSDHGVTFAWQPVPEAVSYAVYLGTQEADLELVDTVTAAELILAETLVRGKRYQWRVDTTLSDESLLTGTTWTFTTLVPLVEDPNLLAWYPLDAGEGGLAIDGSGQEHHAELINMTWDKNIGGGQSDAVVQSQGTGYMTLPFAGQLGDTKELTVQAWFQTHSTKKNALLYIARDASAYVSCYTQDSLLHVDMGGGTAGGGRNRSRDTNRSVTLDPPFPVERWHHIVVTLEEITDTLSLYLNGVEIYTTDDAGLAGLFNEQTNVWLGKSRTDQNHLNGYLDQVKVYDRALTKKEAAKAQNIHPAVAQAPNPRQWAQLYKTPTIKLSWQTHPDTLEYRLLTGIDPGKLTVQSMSHATYHVLPTKKIAVSKPMYWQVETVLADGCVRGPIWQFSLSDVSMDDLIQEAGWTDRIQHKNLYNKPVQDMILTDLNDQRHSFSQYQGRHLLLNMWAPYCPYCRIELQKLPELRETVSEDALFILANTFKNQRSSAITYLAQHPEITYPVTIHNTNEFPAPFNQVQGIPKNYFIAPDGTLKFAMSGMLYPTHMEYILKAAWPQE